MKSIVLVALFHCRAVQGAALPMGSFAGSCYTHAGKYKQGTLEASIANGEANCHQLFYNHLCQTGCTSKAVCLTNAAALDATGCRGDWIDAGLMIFQTDLTFDPYTALDTNRETYLAATALSRPEACLASCDLWSAATTSGGGTTPTTSGGGTTPTTSGGGTTPTTSGTTPTTSGTTATTKSPAGRVNPFW